MTYKSKAWVLSALGALLSMGGWAAPASAQIDRGNLVVTGSVSPNPVASGGQATYAFSIKDDSVFSATGVIVTITLPDGPTFVKCSTSVSRQVCNVAGNTITTTFALIRAHATAKVSIVMRMQTSSSTSDLSATATAHATDAIGGMEPRDGQATATATLLSDQIPVLFLPSQRQSTISCGDNITSGLFQGNEDTLQLAGDMGCAHSQVALKFSASNKTFDLNSNQIIGGVSNDQIKGSVAILIASGATNVTVLGGDTKSSSGIQFFDYCLRDEGGNDGLTINDLRCFRARSAGLDLISDDVQVNDGLIDLTVGGGNATNETPGGVGIHASGNILIKDTIVRRAATIGIWLDGSQDPDGNHHVGQIVGGKNTSRVEESNGIAIQLDGAMHSAKGTYLQGDGSDGVSTSAVVVNGTNMVLDSLEIEEFGGTAIIINGASATVTNSSVEGVGGDSFLVSATGTGVNLNGNKVAKGQRGYVVAASGAVLDTNSAENTVGNAFEIAGDGALMTGNNTQKGKADAFVLSGSGGTYNTNKAESNNGVGFNISGNNGLFEGNTAKSEKKAGGFLVTGTNNSFDTNTAEKNKGTEWVIAPGNIDLGSNRKNGKTFTFGAAGGSFE